jgi:uncharacterized protein YccT (UPF0319 family)
MDIRKFAAADTSTLHLRDGSDELMYADDAKTKPITVTVYGPGSRQYQEAQSRNQNRAIDKLKSKGKTVQTADDKLADQADFLASITVGFENLDYDKLSGHALSLAVYSDPSIGFIAQQVSAHAGEWSHFTKGSAKS